MNETDSSNLENNNSSDDWRSWPPEDYLHTLVHELRTPLMVIAGYTEILSDETRKELHFKGT